MCMSLKVSDSASSQVLAKRHPSPFWLVFIETIMSALCVFAASRFKLIESGLHSFFDELSDGQKNISILSELVGLEVGVAALAVAFVGVNSLSWKDVNAMSIWRAEWEASRQQRIYVFMVLLGMLSAVIAILGGVESWQKNSKTGWVITALLFAVFLFVATLPSVMSDDGLKYLRDYRLRLASLENVDEFASRIDPQLHFCKKASVVEKKRDWDYFVDELLSYFPFGWATWWLIIPLVISVVVHTQIPVLSSVLLATVILGLTFGVSLGLSVKLISRRDGEVLLRLMKALWAYLLILILLLGPMVDALNLVFSHTEDHVIVLAVTGILIFLNVGVSLLFYKISRLWRIKVLRQIFVAEADSVLQFARQGRHELELAQKEVGQIEGVRFGGGWSKRVEENFIDSESVRHSTKTALRHHEVLGMAGGVIRDRVQSRGTSKSHGSVQMDIKVKVEGNKKIEVKIVRE